MARAPQEVPRRELAPRTTTGGGDDALGHGPVVEARGPTIAQEPKRLGQGRLAQEGALCKRLAVGVIGLPRQGIGLQARAQALDAQVLGEVRVHAVAAARELERRLYDVLP